MNKYFLPGYPSFYSALLHIKSSYRYALTIGLVMVIACGWYWGVYLLLEKRLNKQQKILLTHQNEMQARRIRERENSVNDTLDVVHSSLSDPLGKPSTNEPALIQLVSLVQKSGLLLKGCRLDKEQKFDWYLHEEMHIDLSGTLEMVARLLDYFQKNSTALFSCEHLKIVQKNDDLFDIRLKLKVSSLL